MKKLHTEDWGKSLRSRIAFRKLKKKEPSENEAEKYQNLVVSAQEIHAAFEKGEEVCPDFIYGLPFGSSHSAEDIRMGAQMSQL